MFGGIGLNEKDLLDTWHQICRKVKYEKINALDNLLSRAFYDSIDNEIKTDKNIVLTGIWYLWTKIYR
jgi:hypothetical protein